ncbi:hypothetical protein D3C86_1355460 [compost metagenome]
MRKFSYAIAVSLFRPASPIISTPVDHCASASSSARASFARLPDGFVAPKIVSVMVVGIVFFRTSGSSTRTSPTPAWSATLYASATPAKPSLLPPSMPSRPACERCSGLLHSMSGKSGLLPVCFFQYVVSTLSVLYNFIASILSLNDNFPVILKCFFEELIGWIKGDRIIYYT